ncbi:vitamin-D-receptor interacting mediator subunit 4-domain-containing protein [Chaetomidium leptoderma]|uniref:Mediator of RNA polymerase II transcription subunit 4 n=1 Tax=Chaetomidium leptoderma TaxID=669021 RepID=A0AAN6VQC0_9PEZI|nr:vitamin-D-receptor interacting mediator subunit 4-domain-containing protein [Chaetomidium leptoderma]
MDKDMDGRFERLEKGIDNMVNALVKNNPSDKVAEDLLAAEAELSRGLKLLETHQNNYARIQQLRQETSLLDTQIKDIASSLWNMRKELKAIPTTTKPPDGSKHEFTTAELLAYARRISRNTLPPPGVTNGVDLSTSQPSTQPPDPEDSFRLQTQPSQTQTPNTSINLSFNGTVSTPGPISAPTPNMTTNNNDTQHTTTQLPPSQPPTKATAEARLPLHLKPAVDATHDATFLPWPSEAHIRQGGLAAIQRLVDAGIDPRGYDPAEEERKRKAEEQAKKEAEERARQERDAAERRMREERERMARERERARQMEGAGAGGGGGAERRDSVAIGGGAARKPKQFTFLGGDDDDDDEEDED